MLENDPLWYKDAIIYELHVKAFYDSTGDGIGDFRGLAQKLGYLQELGVNTLWLLPFYPSPMRDDGYDISDYRNVHPDYGTLADFRGFVREAHRRGIRVISELVINHTSDQHPWFQAARQAPNHSAKRDYYLWSDTDKRFPETRIIFSDTERSNWAWDEAAQAYYWHRFFSHQPDLNHNNSHVVKAMMRVMSQWFNAGVDGMRLDAVPYLCVREGTSNENLPETHAVIKYMRAELDRHYHNRMFLAEANQWPEDVRDYFGDGDECHMAYHFPLMPRMYMAIAQEDRHPITEIMQQTPDIPETCQWAIFLRNHDELTLEMVTDKERDYMYQMYAAEPRARLNLGIRRRLAPLMDNDLDKIKLMNSLLLSMPGSPIIYYGDEIGMGDNIYLGDRNGVRTPMQWSPDRNAGFSKADPQRLYLPPNMDPVYGFEAVNVEAQSRQQSSLLNWMRRILAVRKNHKAFGRGSLTFLKPRNRKIFAYLREHGDDVILCVANLARTAQPVELDLSAHQGRVPVEMMGRIAFPAIGELPYLLTLPGHGFYWFSLTLGEEAPEGHEEAVPRGDLPMLVLFDGWHSFFRDRVVPWRVALAERTRIQLEADVLPGFLSAQRWYAAKGEPLKRARMLDYLEWENDGRRWLLGLFQTESRDETTATYFLPLGLKWESERDEPSRTLTIARVRQQARVGVLTDAFADEAFSRALVRSIGAGGEVRCANGVIRFAPSSVFAELAEGLNDLAVNVSTTSSNTTATLGGRLFLKVYRRLQAGFNPEVEIGRFLTEVAHFPNSVPVAGVMEYQGESDLLPTTLVLLQGYVENQGDGHRYTVDYLARFLEDCRVTPDLPRPPGEAHAAYLSLIRTLGQRTAELHQALGKPSGDPAFDPEPVSQQELAQWADTVRKEAETTLALIELQRSTLDAEIQRDVDVLLKRRGDIAQHTGDAVQTPLRTVKTRYHGDYHLGQVLLRQNDFVLIDFEGEPARPIPERRQKHSALKDVAGMMRSFNYAAYAALAQVSSGRPGDEALEVFARQWEAQTQAVFLDAYFETMAGTDLYLEQQSARGLIDLFLFEKALYELRYELGHRPDWVHIPLLGILGLLDR